MHVELLDPGRVDRLRACALSYPEVGRTAGVLPRNYWSFTHTALLPATVDFEEAGLALMSWQVQLRAGVRVAASSAEIEEGSVAELRLGVGPFAVRAPCRVVYVITDPDRRGFAYGTLAGHPESGEESFVLDRTGTGPIRFTITAFSRPATTLTRAGGPLARAVQYAVTTRYLRSLSR